MSSEKKRTINITSWVEEYGDELYSWAYYKTSSNEIAEDLVQETFLSAHKNIASFKQESNPKTWLFTTGFSLMSLTSMVMVAVSLRVPVPSSVTSTVRLYWAVVSWSSSLTSLTVISPVELLMAKTLLVFPLFCQYSLLTVFSRFSLHVVSW